MKIKLLLLSSLVFPLLSTAQTVGLQLFAEGFTAPTEVVNAGDSRLFVAEQGGIIKIVNVDGLVNAAPFLNISGFISSGGERGLLGLAFHPQYETNGHFYVNYTNPAGNTVVARYTRDMANPDAADPNSKVELLTVQQPFSNHNGGCLRFGPDGYLYIAMGDGGSSGDPNNNAQNKNSLLGKLLRIDVNNGSPYTNPASNPFMGSVDGADEVWAYGLRNPWKFSFNRTNGELWIADVGQDAREEINRMPSGTAGVNYGWRCYEGSAVYNSNGCGAASNYTMPFAEYTHASTSGCSITGGYVYTGTVFPAFTGKYIFADYCNNKIGLLDTTTGAISYSTAFSGNNITAFGEDNTGELYAAGKTSGKLYRVIDTALGVAERQASAFRVYPNPATGIVKISAQDNSVSSVAIFDLQGKKAIEYNAGGNSELTLPINSLDTGIYLLQITDNAGNISHQRLAVQ